MVDLSGRVWPLIRDLRRRGYIRDACVMRRDSEYMGHAIHVSVEMLDRTARYYELTEQEYVMGGERELANWLDTVEHDIILQMMSATEVRIRVARQQAEMQRDIASARIGPTWVGVDYAKPKDAKAEKRSKDLFIAAAGQPAFDTLMAGQALSMTGSAGTAYTLHKRASYCVERVKDGAKLCAVVPGVPLFDHLLGIKLMVEHDEPEFLETANVAINYLTRAIRQLQFAQGTPNYASGIAAAGIGPILSCTFP